MDECVRALRNGDAQAFDAAYARYHRRIFDFLYRLSGRRDLAEDLFQETFIKLARHATTLREDTDLGAWLFTVARNAYRSHRRWVLIDIGRKREIAVEPRNAAAAPDREAEARRELQDLERALAALPEADRELLLLVGVEGMEQDQAAAVLGIAPAALRQRLSRARTRLAERLQMRERTGT